MPHWTETFFTNHFKEFGFDSKTPEQSEVEAGFIAEVLQIDQGDAVLDICCGVGRHALELARMGYDVVGIDLCESYIDQARKIAEREDITCVFQMGDMREIPFQSRFDAAYNFFTSWGYYSDEENLEVLKQAAKALKTGGRFLLEVMNRDWILREFNPLDVHVIKDKKLIQYRTFLPETNILQAEYIYLDGRKIAKHDSIDLRIYSLHEIHAMFREAGLNPVKNWGDQYGEPFDFENSSMCIVLGEKA